LRVLLRGGAVGSDRTGEISSNGHKMRLEASPTFCQSSLTLGRAPRQESSRPSTLQISFRQPPLPHPTPPQLPSISAVGVASTRIEFHATLFAEPLVTKTCAGAISTRRRPSTAVRFGGWDIQCCSLPVVAMELEASHVARTLSKPAVAPTPTLCPYGPCRTTLLGIRLLALLATSLPINARRRSRLACYRP
jgi:hypothetical protein